MIYRVEVTPRDGIGAERADALLSEIRELGIHTVSAVEIRRLYFLEATTSLEDMGLIASELLADDVIETYSVFDVIELPAGHQAGQTIEVSCRPGVTDTVGETLVDSVRQRGLVGVSHAAAALSYRFKGDATDTQLERIARALLANEVVEQWAVNSWLEAPFDVSASPTALVVEVPVRGLDNDALEAVSKRRRLSLNLEEMQAIQRYYVEAKREPTEMELEMLAQTWSEHCVHKTFKARIDFVETDASGAVIAGTERVVDSMFNALLKDATKKADKPWIKSVFVDNAGIVAFDDEFDIALKVETRPVGTRAIRWLKYGRRWCGSRHFGRQRRPIANTDVLCFGDQDIPHDRLPDGVLHPRRIARGVVAGVEDYGNKMGIPTVNGAIIFEPGYTANPLVFCGCLGILPAGSHRTEPEIGDRVVVLGGRTGRDGIGGATFSSMEMSHETGEIAGSSVQIGHPIMEKQVQEVVCEARDAGLYNAITDCGAGGLSSSIGEMAETLGADVQLEDVPLKYPGLQPWEIC